MTYVVEPGDSLWSIAARFGVSAQAIAAANRLANIQVLYPGQPLIIPTAPAPQFPSIGSVEQRIAKLERELDQMVTIVDNHRRQIADLSRRLQRIEHPGS